MRPVRSPIGGPLGRAGMRLVAVGVVMLAAVGLVGSPPSGAGGFSCTFSVLPAGPLPPGGGTVVVSGTAPGSSVVRVFFDPAGADGPELVATAASSASGAFSATFFVPTTGEILVAVDDYPSTPCVGSPTVAGTVVTRGAPGATVAGVTATTRSLPRTGSSGLRAEVLGGVAALAVGAVLVVAARRRASVRGRT